MNEQTIWKFLMDKIGNAYGVAGLMGNLKAESNLIPTNLQNSYEKKLGMSDDVYTQAVDNGEYTNFVKDAAGYGLAQWTYWSRKQALLNYCRNKGVSIGDLQAQLEFLWTELQGYKTVLTTLKSAKSVKEASDSVLLNFERPADQSDKVKDTRAKYGQTYYDQFANTNSNKGVDTMSYKRQSVVDLIKSWLGRKESDGTHKQIIDIYNSQAKMPRGYKVKYTDAWCATTWSAIAVKLGYQEIMPIECSCYYLIEQAKKMGIWVENDAYVPSPGDAILYDWQDSGVGDNVGAPDHIGIVVSVSNGKINVIEGNYSDSVKERTVSVNGKYIRGYICPKYTDNTVQSTEQAQTPTQTQSAASNSSLITKLSYADKKDTKLAGTYETTANLNLRYGSDSGKYASMVVMPKGTKVRCYGYYNLNCNVKWLYVETTVNNKKYTGFCSIKYLKKC